ncbi:MAG: hypothetical protein K9W42_01235 [Candidatus Heimdallarchaeota archaeon]|nr:hypothetical protein [Candidatus Heimdallarchaeota archaeon]
MMNEIHKAETDELLKELYLIIQRYMEGENPYYLGYYCDVPEPVIKRTIAVVKELLRRKETMIMGFVRGLCKALDKGKYEKDLLELLELVRPLKEELEKKNGWLVGLMYKAKYNSEDELKVYFHEKIMEKAFQMLEEREKIDDAVDELKTLLRVISNSKIYMNEGAGYRLMRRKEDDIRAKVGERIIDLIAKFTPEKTAPVLMKTIQGSFYCLERKAAEVLANYEEEVTRFLLKLSWGAIRQNYWGGINSEVAFRALEDDPAAGLSLECLADEKLQEIAEKALEKGAHKISGKMRRETIIELLTDESLEEEFQMDLARAVINSYKKGKITKEELMKAAKEIIRKNSWKKREGEKNLRVLFEAISWLEEKSMIQEVLIPIATKLEKETKNPDAWKELFYESKEELLESLEKYHT